MLDWPGGELVVTEVGQLEHSQGYGPCELRAYALQGTLAVGSILATPWGAVEVVETPKKSQSPRIAAEGPRISS